MDTFHFSMDSGKVSLSVAKTTIGKQCVRKLEKNSFIQMNLVNMTRLSDVSRIFLKRKESLERGHLFWYNLARFLGTFVVDML